LQLKKAAVQSKVLEDDRFSALFQQKEFQIDTGSSEYKLLHPSEYAVSSNEAKRAVDDANFDAVEAEDSASGGDEDEEEPEDVAALAGAARKVQHGQWGNTSTKGAGKIGKTKMSKRNQLTMYEVRGGHEAAVLRPTAGHPLGLPEGKRAKTMPLSDRLAAGGGGREAQLAVIGVCLCVCLVVPRGVCVCVCVCV
jgi:hypothetical protein